MRRPDPRRWALAAELSLRRANPLWLLMLALAALALVVWAWWLPAAERSAESAQDQAFVLHQQLQRGGPRRTAPAAPAEQQHWERFSQVLGDPAQVQPPLGRLFALVHALELPWLQGQYKASCDGEARLCRLKVQMPVRGSYAQVRALVEQGLRAVPFAALDELGLRREGIADEEIEANLSWTLFLRGPAGVPGAAAAPVPSGASGAQAAPATGVLP